MKRCVLLLVSACGASAGFRLGAKFKLDYQRRGDGSDWSRRSWRRNDSYRRRLAAVGKAVTAADGSYVLPNLPKATFRLEAKAKGFKTFVQTGIIVNLNEAVRVPVVLQLGATVQTIEVSAAASPLNYESPEIKGAVTKEVITDLPLKVSGASARRLFRHTYAGRQCDGYW